MLHAAAFTMTSFLSGNSSQAPIPVQVLVSEKQESGGSERETKPAKGSGAGRRLAAKGQLAQHVSVATTTSSNALSNIDASAPALNSPLELHLDIPVSHTSAIEIPIAKTGPGSSAVEAGTGGNSILGTGGGSPFGSEAGSGTGPGSGAGASGRAYAKADYAHNPVPEYPERARRQGWEGTVLLDVLITLEGKPAKVEIKETSGFEILDRAAAQAVMGWRFHPARYGATALEGWVKVPIVFRLGNKRD
jgi:TonB family protein